MATWEREERKKFAREVKLNKPYYTLVQTVAPWGGEPVWWEWVFDHRQVFTGAAMSGAVSAEGACLKFGPISDEKPAGHIRPMFPSDDDRLYAEPADVVQVRKSREKKPARR